MTNAWHNLFKALDTTGTEVIYGEEMEESVVKGVHYYNSIGANGWEIVMGADCMSLCLTWDVTWGNSIISNYCQN